MTHTNSDNNASDDNGLDYELDTSAKTTPARTSHTGRTIEPLSRGDIPRTDTSLRDSAQRDAAADITRGQIERIFARDEQPALAARESQATTGNPYERTHTPDSAASADAAAEHFKKYHTAWQDYYQKYYEDYYTTAVRQTAEQLRKKAEADMDAGLRTTVHGSGSPAPETDTPHSAARKLQSQFKQKVGERAGKVRRSRHFWPALTAVTVAGVFLFLQYNRLLVANVAAYVSPGNVDPQNIIVDPTTDTKVGPDPRIIIPKINVDAPVIYTVTEYDNDKIEAALKDGVVKYAIPSANAFPGQVGNLVIGGHSSNDVFDDGKYKFVFVQLEKLVVGDTMYLNYQGTRYTYRVSKTQTIEPNQLDVITAPVTTPTVTLITCTPVGTALHRFIVFAEQISPDPSGATAASNPSTATSTSIPGNSPTLLQRIFGQ